jgi:hypothetical protein
MSVTLKHWCIGGARAEYDGDTEPETLVSHAYDYRRWRITQTIKKLGFSLCFWV